VKPDLRDAERLQGFEAEWTSPAETVGRASWRWSLVGNAVTVPVAQWVGSRLSDPGQYELGRDHELENARNWPRAARFNGTKRFEVKIGSYPVWKPRKPLHHFLKFPTHLLSSRATEGFLRRTELGTLRFVDGFRESVRRHLQRMHNLDRALSAPAE
jgi:DNA (cytosine-5)-methyltransferase 1